MNVCFARVGNDVPEYDLLSQCHQRHVHLPTLHIDFLCEMGCQILLLYALHHSNIAYYGFHARQDYHHSLHKSFSKVHCISFCALEALSLVLPP
jgi:hypothetical protein